MSPRLPALTVAALALLALAAPARARTVTARNVETAQRQISCFAVIPIAGGGIECHSPFLPVTGELDPYVALKARGHARLGQRSDYPGYDGRARRLRAGDRWARGAIRCRYRDERLTCRNRSRHGLTVAPSGVRRF